MLLTSAGITNHSIRTALRDLVGQDFANTRVVMVTTASTAVAGHLDWHVTELNRVYGLGWAEFNVLEFNGLPRAIVAERLESADVIYMAGGNAYHLVRSIVNNDLGDQILDLLERTVYVGASAGSMIFSKDFTRRKVELFGDQDDLYLHATPSTARSSSSWGLATSGPPRTTRT